MWIVSDINKCILILFLGIQSEPPMQSKKRTEGPQTTLTNGFYDYGPDQDEYALLGNQDKFAHNVKYKLRESLRSREVSPPKQMKLQKVCCGLLYVRVYIVFVVSSIPPSICLSFHQSVSHLYIMFGS